MSANETTFEVITDSGTIVAESVEMLEEALKLSESIGKVVRKGYIRGYCRGFVGGAVYGSAAVVGGAYALSKLRPDLVQINIHKPSFKSND